MNTSFDELEAITDKMYSDHPLSRSVFHHSVINLLASYKIRLRRKDGSNPLITISYPTSSRKSIVVGLRYTKNDGTKTEDHFLFQPRRAIKKCYGKKLEKLFPEYKGVHKLQR